MARLLILKDVETLREGRLRLAIIRPRLAIVALLQHVLKRFQQRGNLDGLRDVPVHARWLGACRTDAASPSGVGQTARVGRLNSAGYEEGGDGEYKSGWKSTITTLRWGT